MSVDVAYELVITHDGGALLTCGGELMWSSDNDDEFAETEDIVIDFEDDAQLDELVAWLVDHEYLPPDIDVDIVSEDDADLSAQA